MPWRRWLIPALIPLLLAIAPPLRAQEQPRREGPPPQASHRTLLPADSVSEHEITIGGRKLAYSAVAGTLALKDAQGDTTAEIFYVSFTAKDNPASAPARPVTYLFNGGPGAASAYLDLGAVGPRALAFGDDPAQPPKSDHVADNPDSWLPFTDLVFIDPVGTGWSRATDAEKAAKEFWGVTQDLATLADIVRLHLTKSGRLTSPVYLAGESYGGFRASRLARDLAERGIAPAGIVMVSPVIEFGLSGDSTLAMALRLPSYAAAKLGDKAAEPGALDEAETFALHDYLVALAAGPGRRGMAEAVTSKIAQLTGLDRDTVARWDGRIPPDAYIREMARHNGRVVSRYDAGVSMTDPDPLAGGHDDASLDATIAPFTTAFVAYARDELGFKTDQQFHLLNGDVSRHWDWESGHGPVRSVGASNALRRALALQPRLTVMIAHGVADLVTPYMASRYVKDHMPQALGDRITLKLYAGGHMLYLRPASRHRLRDDAAEFYAARGD